MTEAMRIDRPAVRRPRVRRAVTLAVAALAGLVVWVVGVPLAGVELTVGSGASAQSVGPASVLVTPLLVGGVGWALLAFLESRSARGRRIWRIIAWTVLAVSLLGPVGMGAGGGVLVTLLAMHLVVGVTLIFGLAPATADPSRDAGRVTR
ncbi:DUF6069 family protein [Micromonospora sp. NPDC049559]|uniref:DUF6069 family protein n=1 Tax=Micromonospora sp. NPDC049559 TaxID=3155923 RepID=UPI003428119F